MTFAPGAPLAETAVRLVPPGSGELGRERRSRRMRLCEVLALDRYAGAPECRSPSATPAGSTPPTTWRSWR